MGMAQLAYTASTGAVSSREPVPNHTSFPVTSDTAFTRTGIRASAKEASGRLARIHAL